MGSNLEEKLSKTMKQMNKSFMAAVFAAFFLFLATGMQAQVVIGDATTGTHPVPGSLLDLSPAGNSGLLPQQVALSAIDKIPTAFTERGGEGPATDLQGLLVYNTNVGFEAGAGLYVWDGAQWHNVCYTIAPTATTPQTFCGSVTVADLTATGTGIKWYAATSRGTALVNTAALVSGTKYYASQTVNGCESTDRTEVTATVNAIPAAPTATTPQTFCGSATVADLVATGSSIKWYSASSGGTALVNSAALVSGKWYYASQTVNGCESTMRKQVLATINYVSDVDGNHYCYGTFGSAGIWMTENLKVTKYASGASLEYNSEANDNTDKYFYRAGDAIGGGPTYGYVYTWPAATGRANSSANEQNNPDQTRVQGICPNGWHVPSDYEWSQLEEVIANDASNEYSLSGATEWDEGFPTTYGYRGEHGMKMKSQIAYNEILPNGTSKPFDEGGINLILQGDVYWPWTIDAGMVGYYTTSSSRDRNFNWCRIFEYNMIGVKRAYRYPYDYASVRCKKD
jgi:uncharacterized protein (TIGR02145 family)